MEIKLKILIAGNMVNVGYLIAKILRERNIDVTLLMNTNPAPFSDPLLFDPSLKNKYPSWIHFYDTSSKLWIFKILKEMWKKEYDIVQAHVELPMFCNLISKPYIAFCQGSDMRELAFAKTIKGRLLHRALKRAKVVLYNNPDLYPLAEKLGLGTRTFGNARYIPYSVGDVTNGINHTANDKLTIFHPTSHSWRLKGNNIFIKGFAKFVKNHSATLIIVDWGEDVERTKELINSLEISSHVKIINTLDKKGMQEYYNSCDVVADQFILGSMGTISLETLLNGKPLLTSINENDYLNVYDNIPPVLNAKTEEQICQQLELAMDKKTRENIGTKGKKWYQKWHSTEFYATILIATYKDILNGENK